MYAQLAAFLLGVWLTAAPGALGLSNPARANFHVVGPLVALFALTASYQVMRPVRWVNLPIGAWLVVAPWVLGYASWPETVWSVAVGLGVAVLSPVRGTVTEPFGGGWSALWRKTVEGVR
ncbi:MAG TPA: SPW repeat protein [Fimbriiglobus sp.]|nr:SPW repeat protein [Fimbriiglobus sp.]